MDGMNVNGWTVVGTTPLARCAVCGWPAAVLYHAASRRTAVSGVCGMVCSDILTARIGPQMIEQARRIKRRERAHRDS